ncbi:hypothetical protein L6164_001175 [Bauhinia variegata]|uniref:Uncharacterized protein n=1 Tax=Bauhinia variegata TaxID=167791 RepID=A0ACB9QAX6_BAUVA|nr:hypothetical protein L6164_001175 [Bauhinia variegata]
MERALLPVEAASRGQNRPDGRLDPAALLAKFEHIGSADMLGQVGWSYGDQIRLVKEQTKLMTRNIGIIQIVHDRLKSDLRTTAEGELASASEEITQLKENARSSDDKLQKALADVGKLQEEVNACKSSLAGKSNKIRFLEERLASNKAAADAKVVELEASVHQQTALLQRYKEERNRTLASRARVLDRAANKLAHTLLNASKDGFENCLLQVSLHPRAPSLETLRSMTSYLKVVRDGAIIDPEDEYEPDLSIEASDLEIGSGDEGGA